jgi:hypothetical protein
MKDATDEQKRIARECASVPGGVAELKRAGLSEGRAILLISKHNPKKYNQWRAQPSTPRKATDIARSATRFHFQGV